MLGEKEYTAFLDKVYNKTGLNLNHYKEKQMKRRIDTLLQKHDKQTYDQYYEYINQLPGAFEEFMDKVTINVSEFFRNPERWEVLKTEIIPMLQKNNPGRLKIWSAACSSGQEPYSLSMLFTELGIPHEILATDLDKKILDRASRGVYDNKELTGIAHQYHKYIDQTPNSFKILDSIGKNITFKEHNLLTSNYPKGFDLIVCRNVMIYFKEDIKGEIYKNFNDSLNKDCVLFVGSTEQIFFPQKINFKSVQTFFYQKL